MTIPIPPGFRNGVQTHRIFIPDHPNRPDAGGEWYDIDVGPILTPDDDDLDELLMVIPVWYGTLRFYTYISSVLLKNVKRQRLDELEKSEIVSRSYIEKNMLPGDYDYVYWEQQYEWLSAQVEAIKRLMPLLQTANANKRTEMTPGFQPPQS